MQPEISKGFPMVPSRGLGVQSPDGDKLCIFIVLNNTCYSYHINFYSIYYELFSMVYCIILDLVSIKGDCSIRVLTAN